MTKSAKLFIASIILLASSAGFFLGAFAFNNNAKKGIDIAVVNESNEAKIQKKHHKDKHTFKAESAYMDSVLQITSEQKAALERQRTSTDSSFKALFKQKKKAEKKLSKALIERDSVNIAAARADVLKAQEAMLDLRIEGVKNWNKILTKEQIEKFRQLKQERKKKFKKHWKKHEKRNFDTSDDSAESTSSENASDAE